MPTPSSVCAFHGQVWSTAFCNAAIEQQCLCLVANSECSGIGLVLLIASRLKHLGMLASTLYRALWTAGWTHCVRILSRFCRCLDQFCHILLSARTRELHTTDHGQHPLIELQSVQAAEWYALLFCLCCYNLCTCEVYLTCLSTVDLPAR